MKKFRNKYRIPSARAQWWDYGQNAAYFITICSQNRQHYFGEIENDNMVLSQTGVIADILWYEIPNHHPFVDLGEFVVMPNHIHGILILNKPDGDDIRDGHGDDRHDDDRHVVVETGHALSLPTNPPPNPPSETPSGQIPIGKQRFQNIGKNTVSSIVGSYKSALTKHANRLGLPNGWQALFYDHIIRNDAEYQRIAKYIIHNPINWKNDRFNSER